MGSLAEEKTCKIGKRSSEKPLPSSSLSNLLQQR
jgi:hypothetical protein